MAQSPARLQKRRYRPQGGPRLWKGAILWAVASGVAYLVVPVLYYRFYSAPLFVVQRLLPTAVAGGYLLYLLLRELLLAPHKTPEGAVIRGRYAGLIPKLVYALLVAAEFILHEDIAVFVRSIFRPLFHLFGQLL